MIVTQETVTTSVHSDNHTTLTSSTEHMVVADQKEKSDERSEKLLYHTRAGRQVNCLLDAENNFRYHYCVRSFLFFGFKCDITNGELQN